MGNYFLLTAGGLISVCMDESPKQLIGEIRTPIAASPGQVIKYDYERYQTIWSVQCFHGF